MSSKSANSGNTPKTEVSEPQVYITKPLSLEVENVKTDKCPQNQVFTKENITISAKGCTEDEAKRKIYKKLLSKAEKLRKDRKVGDCEGSCGDDGGDCTLIAPIQAGEITCHPAKVQGCSDGVGFVCTYIGPVRAECICAI